MMKTKPILCPERLRHVPRQFSWIDQRLVRHRHIQGRSTRALALYLLLCTVADAQGSSYYSDATTGKILSFTSSELRAARAELVSAGLIAYREPFYQVLSLEPEPGPTSVAPPPTGPTAATSSPPLPVTETRFGEVRTIADVLRAMSQQPGEEEQAP